MRFVLDIITVLGRSAGGVFFSGDTSTFHRELHDLKNIQRSEIGIPAMGLDISTETSPIWFEWHYVITRLYISDLIIT